MRWLSFSILLFALIVVQVSMGYLFGIIKPDFLLLLAVLLAYRGSGPKMLIACWILGFAKDLTSEASLGCYAFAFGLIALLIVRVRELFYGDHPLALIILTALCSFIVEQMILALGFIKGDLAESSYATITWALLFAALFTGGLAPYGQWLVMKMHRRLGLPRWRNYSH